MQPFCWWCGKNLQLQHFAMVVDQLGHQHKVHKCCKADAEKEIRPVTAQPKPANTQVQAGPAGFMAGIAPGTES